MSPYNLLRLQAGRERRLKAGHPWAFSNEIVMQPAYRTMEPGGVIRLEGDDGTKFGLFTFNPHSLIAARKLDRNADATIDEAWLSRKLDDAIELRARLELGTHHRLIHAEADGFPGLIVDRYGDVAVIQANTAWADRITAQLVPLLAAKLGLRGVVGRNDSAARELEGLKQSVEALFGDVGNAAAIEGGVEFPIDPLEGQKTGFFHDQRPHRDLAARLAAGLGPDAQCLDLFCHVGAFGLRMAKAGQAQVTLVDASEFALEHARRAAERNGVADRITTQKADVFDALERFAAAGARFDIVICDPPAFAKNKKDIDSALRAYGKLARQTAALVKPGGFLFCASCSHHAAPAAFAEATSFGLWKSGRSARIFAQGGAGGDHPVHPGLPESAYLKGIWFKLD